MLFVGLVSVLWLAFRFAAADPVAPPAPLRIGAILSLTGRTAFLGDPERKTLQALVREVNRDGGIRGRPLELVLHDSRSERQGALEAARLLASDSRILAVIGPSLSVESLAAAPVLEQARIPMISLSAARSVVDPVRPWIFKVGNSDLHAVGCILEYLSRRGVRGLALVSASDDFGRDGRRQVTEGAPDFGMELTASLEYPVDGPDEQRLRSFLETVGHSQAEALLVWGNAPGPPIVARIASEVGLRKLLVFSHSMASRNFIRDAGRCANGALLPASPLLVCESLKPEHPQKKVLLGYKRWFEHHYRTEASPFGGHAWDAFQMVKEAMTTAGPSRARIRAYLEETRNFVGTSGIFQFSPADHDGLTSDSFVMVRIQEGQWMIAP